MLLGARQFFEKRGAPTPPLPYDAEVEYLESTGSQYIELPFGFYKTDEITADFSIDTSQTNDKYIVSPIVWNNSNNRFAMGVHSGGVYTCGYGAFTTISTVLSPDTANNGAIHHWEYKDYLFAIPELSIFRDVSSVNFGLETSNLKLFYGYNSNTIGRMAAYKHIKNGSTAIDLIPVRFTNEHGVSEGAMYDRVSGQLFRNAGTGAFIYGNDKS